MALLSFSPSSLSLPNLPLVFSGLYAYSIQLALDTAPRPQVPVVIIPSTFHKSTDISPKVLEKFQFS